MDGATLTQNESHTTVPEDTKAFFFETMAQNGMELGGIVLDEENQAHRQAFYEFLDDLSAQATDIGPYLARTHEAIQKFLMLQRNAQNAVYLALEEQYERQFTIAAGWIQGPAAMDTIEVPFSAYVTRHEPQDVASITDAQMAEIRDRAAAGMTAKVETGGQHTASNLPSFLRPNAGRAKVQMNPEEYAAHQAQQAGVSEEKPAPFILTPAQRVDETAPIAESNAKAPLPARSIWDLPDNELDAVLEKSEDKQDAFVKKALADWYERYFNAEDLTEKEVDIIAIHFTRDTNRIDILNMIIEDARHSRGAKKDLSEFDHMVIDRHVELDPEAIERSIANAPQEQGLNNTNDSKLLSWLKPAAGAIAVSAAASMTARAALDIATGGVAGAVAGAVGGAAGAYASERLKFKRRIDELVAQNPDMALLSKQELRQEVIKQDKMTSLQHRLAKLETDYRKTERQHHDAEERLRRTLEDYGGAVDEHKDILARLQKDVARAKKRMDGHHKARNRVALKLETTRHEDASQYSFSKHMLSRVMMGAALGTWVGGALALEPVQNFLSDSFNAIGGFAASLLPEFAQSAPEPLAVDTGFTQTASLGLGADGFDADAAAAEVSDYLAATEAEDAATDPIADTAATDPVAAAADNVRSNLQAALDGAAAPDVPPLDAMPAADVVTLPEASLNVISALQNAGLEPLTTGDIAAAVDSHFGGDIPSRFAPYIDNLASDNPAFRAEAAQSIAFLLVENNAELAKEGHRELASAIMAANVMESGLDSADSAVQRSIDGLAYYQPDLSAALQQAGATDGVDLTRLSALAQQAATGDITLQPPQDTLAESRVRSPHFAGPR